MRLRAVGLALLFVPATIAAQVMTIALGPVRVAPTGALAHYATAGWGGMGSLTWRRPDRHIGLRAEASYVAFPFGPADHLDYPAPSQVPVRANTGATRLVLLGGPEFVTRLGPVRTGVHVMAGPVGAFTVMSLDGLGTDDRYSRRKRFSDFAGAAQLGGSLGVSLARTVALDLSVAYGVLTPTSYGLRDQIKVGVISGPYWGPERRWSQFASFRLQVAIGA